jgi:HK97 family phage portal protein
MGFFNFGKSKEIKQAYPVRQSMLLNAGQAQYAEMSFERLAEEGYAQNAIAFACIHKIKQGVSGFEVYVQDSKGGIVENHPALNALKRPNAITTQKDLIGSLVANLMISGNAYLYNSLVDESFNPRKPALSIFSLVPDAITVEAGTVLPNAYIMGGDTKNHRYPVDRLTGKCAIMHIKDFNPTDMYFGQSRLKAAARAIDRFNEAEQWNYSLVKNGAKPTGLLKAGEGLTTEQFQEKVEEIKRHWEGSNTVKLVDAGFEWQQMSLSPLDMDFRESQIMAARYIANVFGVPSQLLNIPESQTFSNYEQASLSFWQDTVIPIAEEVYSKLGMWLFSMYENSEGLELKINLDKVSALDVIRRERAERYTGLVGGGIVTINEARSELDYEDIEGGNELYISGSQVPLNAIDDMLEGDVESDRNDEVEDDSSK